MEISDFTWIKIATIFLRVIYELKQYALEFENDGIIKTKKNPSECVLKYEKGGSIIMINQK